MASRFRNTLELAKSSLAVMTAQPKLLVFPLLISGFTLAIAFFLLAPLVLIPTGHPFTSPAHWNALVQEVFHQSPAHAGHAHHQFGFSFSSNPLLTAYLAVFYFISMFCATFFNVAFYHEILAALRGGEVSLSRGLQAASRRWKPILMWTLFAGLVTWLITWLEQKFDFFGRIVLRLLGLAWSVAAVLVIPVLVTDEDTANPVEMLKRSAGVLNRAWGEGLLGYAGLSLLGGGLVWLGSLLFLGLAIGLAVMMQSVLIGIAGGVLWLAGVSTYSYLLHVAGQVFRGALYLYASEGLVTGSFTPEMFANAWKRRAQR